MAEKKKYNSILISGRKDQTLTYSKYVKDEESGESVKESLDKKVNVTDKLETQQIKDGAITNEKMAAGSVGNTNLQDGSVSNEKLEDGSITNEKLAENSITKDKLQDKTIGVEKLDNELRQAIAAATGLPENLVETIQNVDDTLRDHQSQLDDKQSQIDDKQQQITANDEDISLLQTRSTQMEETIKGIAATGGASQATAVTYDNEKSGLDAVNIQSAIDEIINNLGHYETNEEWLRAYTDTEGKFLWGIRIDGSIDWSVGIPTPIRTKLQEIVTKCQQDKTDLTEAIATAKEELTSSLQTYQHTTDASITKLQEGKVDKEEGKSLIEDEVKECFRVIENEEFIKAIVDAEDKVLFGIYRDSGKPYFPLNEMYHVEQNEEFFALWLDADNHVLLGIRRDGQIIGEIHAVNAMKQVITQLQSDLAALQEKVGTINTNLKEFLDVFSLQENPEYMAIETDAEGKILASTNADGSHYIHNVKSETIPEEFSHIEDPEGRTEITTDAEDKILGYRDSEGTRHEHKISANHINLSDEAAKEVSEAFKSAGIKMENPSDFSKDSHIELPIPRIAAQVRIYAPKLPTTKQDDIEAEIEYNDKDGNYFRKPVILNAQGSSSMLYYVKNMAIDITDGSEIKFGDFPTQDSFHLKKYYIDAFRGQCVVGYWLMEQVYKTHPVNKQYPYDYLYSKTSITDGLGETKKDFFTGSKCHPDGFPIIITWVDTNTQKETWMGVYAWNLKKSKEVYYADKKEANNIILDGVLDNTALWGGSINWGSFEIRNPKSLKDIDENKYDGDNPKELSNTDKLSKSVKEKVVRLSAALNDIKWNQTRETFEKYFIVNPFIDYFLVSQLIYNWDGFRKNWIWCTWDGTHWTPTLYDVDSIFGLYTQGVSVKEESATSEILGSTTDIPSGYLNILYSEDIKNRYKELRDLNVFSVNNVITLLCKWLDSVGYDNLKKDLALYNETPSYRNSNTSSKWKYVKWSWVENVPIAFEIDKSYKKGDMVYFHGGVYEAQEIVVGEYPCSPLYTHYPVVGGFHNSVYRVANWLEKRIDFLDNTYNYNK